MSKLVIEIDLKTPLKNNDVIRFNKGLNKFEVVSYDTFNQALYKEIKLTKKDLETSIDHIHKIIDEFKNLNKEEHKLFKDALKLAIGRDL